MSPSPDIRTAHGHRPFQTDWPDTVSGPFRLAVEPVGRHHRPLLTLECALRHRLLLAVLALGVSACGGASEPLAPTTTDNVVTTTTSTTTTTVSPTTSTTESPTTTTTRPAAPPVSSSIVAGEDPDVDDIVLAFQIAFDSVSGFELKAAYIDDPTGLEGTVTKYLSTGDSMGGISVNPTDVVIEGDTATVTYDLLFGGNPTYPDLTGTAVKTSDGWKVPRSQFCSLMSSARVGCPSL